MIRSSSPCSLAAAIARRRAERARRQLHRHVVELPATRSGWGVSFTQHTGTTRSSRSGTPTIRAAGSVVARQLQAALDRDARRHLDHAHARSRGDVYVTIGMPFNQPGIQHASATRWARSRSTSATRSTGTFAYNIARAARASRAAIPAFGLPVDVGHQEHRSARASSLNRVMPTALLTHPDCVLHEMGDGPSRIARSACRPILAALESSGLAAKLVAARGAARPRASSWSACTTREHVDLDLRRGARARLRIPRSRTPR